MTEQLSPLALQALAIVEESGAIISANHAHPHTIRPRLDSSLKRARKI